jgi:multidrug efflux pump subunit AcrA (membrane-fusion protein)
MKRIIRIILTAFAISGLAVSVLACGSGSDEAGLSENQIVTVQRGDLAIDITAVGNLEFSHQEELTFSVTGTVDEILVEEGESVEEGQVLATLDTSEWEEQLSVLEEQVTQAEHQVTQAKRQVTAKEMDVLQAQINLQTAEDNLYKVEELAEAKAAVEDAEWDLGIAEALLEQAGASQAEFDFRVHQVDAAKTRLAEAERELAEILAGSSIQVTTDWAIEIAMKELQIEINQGRLEDAQIAVEDAQIAVEDAEIAVEDAQEALDEAKESSLEVIAPFTGFITKVNVSTGDVVNEGRVAVILADPNEFEANILVNEIDIFNIREGAQATIQVDALAGISLPAKVTYVSPTAAIQQGVVNYRVKVEVESLAGELEPLVPPEGEEQSPANPEAVDEALDEAVKAGRISREQADVIKERFGQVGKGLTPEQIEQFIERFSQGGGGFGRGGDGFGQGAGGTQLPPAMVRGAVELREGLSITVSIIVEERNDVLLVPNSAITYQGGTAYTQVSKNGVIEKRVIRAGVSDWQYTEITGGLSEGEQVVVPQATTTTTTSQQQPPGGFRIPGVGGFGK